MNQRREEQVYRHYTADSFAVIMQSLGAKNVKSYSELCAQKPEEPVKDPAELARSRAEKMGLKVVSQ